MLLTLLLVNVMVSLLISPVSLISSMSNSGLPSRFPSNRGPTTDAVAFFKPIFSLLLMPETVMLSERANPAALSCANG